LFKIAFKRKTLLVDCGVRFLRQQNSYNNHQRGQSNDKRFQRLFSQLLHHFPRTEFAQLVAKHQAEHRSKRFFCCAKLVAMLFFHMAHADSLREESIFLQGVAGVTP